MFKRTKITFGLGLITVFSMLALSACDMTGGMSDGGEAAGGGIGAFLPIILLIAVFYFILIRPQNKKNKEVNAMRSALKRGDWVTTIGGLRGRIVKVRDDLLTIEVGTDKVKLEIMKWGISKIDEAAPERRAPKKEREEEPLDDEEEEEQPKRKPKKLAAAPKVEEKNDPEDESEDPDEDEDEEDEDNK